MRTRDSKKIRLGIFVLAGLAIFIASVYFLGQKQSLFGNTTVIGSVFKNVTGLQSGNNLRFAGVNVGTVKRIEILNDTAVYVEMNIQNGTIKFLKKESVATVGSDGLVGSMIINIIPPPGGKGTAISAGDTIPSLSKIDTADMLETLNTTNENAAQLTADLLKITKAINTGEGVLGKLINDQEMAANLRNSLENIEKVSRSSSETVDQVNVILSQIDMNEGIAGVLFRDTVAKGKLLNILDDLERSSAEIDSISRDIRSFSRGIEDGEGVISYALNDTTYVNHLENTLLNVEEASIRFNENMEALKHNFFFRGYFKKLERQQKKALEKK